MLMSLSLLGISYSVYRMARAWVGLLMTARKKGWRTVQLDLGRGLSGWLFKGVLHISVPSYLPTYGIPSIYYQHHIIFSRWCVPRNCLSHDCNLNHLCNSRNGDLYKTDGAMRPFRVQRAAWWDRFVSLLKMKGFGIFLLKGVWHVNLIRRGFVVHF